jgi:hypothetical protein
MRKEFGVLIIATLVRSSFGVMNKKMKKGCGMHEKVFNDNYGDNVIDNRNWNGIL